jgi:hypothetical protein
MTDSRAALKSLRPQLSIATAEDAPPLLHFQNNTLRPLLKMQHELLVRMVQSTQGFDQLLHHTTTKEEYTNVVIHFISRQAALRHQLIGLIIGHFTHTEWLFYEAHNEEIKKRIVHMAGQRVASLVEFS